MANRWPAGVGLCGVKGQTDFKFEKYAVMVFICIHDIWLIIEHLYKLWVMKGGYFHGFQAFLDD